MCMRARYVVVGEHMAVEAIRKGNIVYCFLASDAGVNTQKKIKDKCAFYNVEINDSYTSESLSQAIGKENIKVLAIEKKGAGFVKLFRK